MVFVVVEVGSGSREAGRGMPLGGRAVVLGWPSMLVAPSNEGKRVRAGTSKSEGQARLKQRKQETTWSVG